MVTWKKWAGFVIWCVLLFGVIISAGTDLWPLGPIGPAAVMMVLGAGPVEQAIQRCSCAFPAAQSYRERTSDHPGGVRMGLMHCRSCGAMLPVEECRRKEP